MTVSFERSTLVRAPIDQVFDLALSIDAHLGSMAGHQEQAIAGVIRGRIGLGEDVTWRARHLGIRWTMTSRIVEFDRPTFFADEQVRGPFARYRHEHSFSAMKDGSAVVDRVSFEAPFGPLGSLAEPILRWYVRRLIDHRNVFLARQAEQGTTE
ncbi:MAG: SRPBCC family protein [Actinobacteria bacterium]|nr:MAG: SRPBCC family protein [Actinomycetota bacterium]